MLAKLGELRRSLFWSGRKVRMGVLWGGILEVGLEGLQGEVTVMERVKIIFQVQMATNPSTKLLKSQKINKFQHQLSLRQQ